MLSKEMISLSDIFEDFFPGISLPQPSAPARMPSPKVNIKETDKAYVITAALPGVSKDEVKVTVQDGTLTISGEHKDEKEEKGKGYLRQEMSYGCFQRAFVLPAGVHPEEVQASHKDGILTVTVPRLAQGRPRGVNVKVD